MICVLWNARRMVSISTKKGAREGTLLTSYWWSAPFFNQYIKGKRIFSSPIVQRKYSQSWIILRTLVSRQASSKWSKINYVFCWPNSVPITPPNCQILKFLLFLAQSERRKFKLIYVRLGVPVIMRNIGCNRGLFLKLSRSKIIK